MKTASLALCAIVFVATSQLAHAQVISSPEVERGLRYPGTAPYDGEPYTQRYSYGTPAANIYINGSGQAMWNLYYQDRAERAAKFGYPMPKEYEMTPPPPAFPAARLARRRRLATLACSTPATI